MIYINHIPQFIFSAVGKGISKTRTFSLETIIDYYFEAVDYIYLKNIIPEQVNSIQYFENNMLSLQLYSELKNILDKKEYNVISLRFGLENDAPNEQLPDQTPKGLDGASLIKNLTRKSSF